MRRVPHAEQDMLTLTDSMSLAVFMRVPVVQALVLNVVSLSVSMFVFVSSFFTFGLVVILIL